ncbi:hypothetical protein F444_22391 [Phytophthora nicotianae P1976]|uniref:Uncharacterized protein n=1 Tax=Phytophthora nicotianae P1976 TaxID=1317066 RepID=A0A080YXX7_PHYNI|nr:hypothetical protein F444_22391 [Phytophthora nicotianae P1976]
MNNWWKLSIKEHKEALSEEKMKVRRLLRGPLFVDVEHFFLIQLVFRVSIAFIAYF